MSAIGTASPGGVLPEVLQSFTVTAAGNCGALTVSTAVSSTSNQTSCGSGNLAGIPWLEASINGNTVSFIGLSNTSSSPRTGTVTINSVSGVSAVVTVTEAASNDSLAVRQVRTLYESIMGRDADSSGFSFWTGIGGSSLGYMADDFFTSPESFNTNFVVMAAYQAALGAPPTFAQFEAAVAALRAGKQTATDLFNSLIAGVAGYTTTNVYQNLLDRYPTFLEDQTSITPAASFEKIVGYPASAVSPVSAANNEFQSTGTFAGSPANDHTNGLFIRLLYFTMLARDPDPGGLSFWQGVANSGGAGLLFQGAAGQPTRLQILGTGIPGQGFVFSVEFTSEFCPMIQ